MNYCNADVVFQEVPNEIAISYTISGCPNMCEGCHSTHTWDPTNGIALTKSTIKAHVDAYCGMITCVCFFGGEWLPIKLSSMLQFVSEELKLKTALYTGLENMQDQRILKYLDYLKTGPWIAELGGLSSPTTNQRFVNVKTGELLTHLFIKDFNL